MRSVRVLLAEDNVVNQQLAAAILEKGGHEVTVVQDGREAVAAFVAQPDGFDLILMDVELPELNGLEATAAIRESETETGGRVRILALTSHSGELQRERCFAAGMDGHLAKPIDVESLLAAVTAPDVALSSAAAAAPGTDSSAGRGAVDWDVALARVDGDTALLRRMVDIFLELLDGMTADVRQAVAAGDARALERAAHKLRGSLGHFSAVAALAAAENLEEAGASLDLDGAEDTLRTLETALDRVRREFEERIASGGL